MNKETKALVVELNRIRLDDDQSYASLAAAIGIDAGGLHKLLNDPTRDPWDRTIHKIRRFLEQRKPKGRAA